MPSGGFVGSSGVTQALPETDSTQHWDKCLLVRYPSRQHFLSMMANGAYRDALVYRYAGLERTILLRMQG